MPPGLLLKQQAVGKFDDAKAQSPQNSLKKFRFFARSNAEKIDPTQSKQEQSLPDFALVVSDENMSLVANGLPPLDHGMNTLPEICDFLGMACLNLQQQASFQTLVATASSNEPAALISLLSFLLRIVNDYCVHPSEGSTLLCLCPEKLCPIFVIRLLSGSPALLRALALSFELKHAGVLTLSIRLAWRLYHIARVCAPRCSRFRCLTLNDEETNGRGSFWSSVVAELVQVPETREAAFRCFLGLLADQTMSELDEGEETCLFRDDVINPWLIPHAFTLLQGTPLPFQLKGLTDLFAALLGQGSLIHAVNYMALGGDSETGVLLLLSELSHNEYKNYSATGDIVITLMAQVATTAMSFFLRANFTSCVNRFLSRLNAWGPLGFSLRRVRMMRHYLMSLMKCVRQETGAIGRDIGHALFNLLDLSTIILHFSLFHGHASGHLPQPADYNTSSLLPPSVTLLPPQPFAVSLRGPLKLHLSVRRVNVGWQVVAEDLQLLRMLQDVYKSLDLNPELYVGPEEKRTLVQIGQGVHAALNGIVSAISDMSLREPHLSMIPTPYPSRRKNNVTHLRQDGSRLVATTTESEDLPPDNPNMARFDTMAPRPVNSPNGPRVSPIAECDELPPENPNMARFDTVAPRSIGNHPRHRATPSIEELPGMSRQHSSGSNSDGSMPSVAAECEDLPPESPNMARFDTVAASGTGANSESDVKVAQKAGHSRGAGSRDKLLRMRADHKQQEQMEDASAQLGAQADVLKVVQDMVVALDAALLPHEATMKSLQARVHIEAALSPNLIMEGPVTISHRLNSKPVTMHLESDRLCYQTKEGKHVVPLSAIKYIEPDVVQGAERASAEDAEISASFSLVSKVDSFVVTCPEVEVRDTWVNLISFAIARFRMDAAQQGDCLDGLYVLATQKFINSSQAALAAHSLSNTLFAFRNIRVSAEKPAALKVQKTNVVPLYTADTQCTSCSAPLNVFRRAQHCRHCGRGFCQKCISRARGTRFNMSKICYKCYVELDDRDSNTQSLLVELSGGKPASLMPPVPMLKEGLKRTKAAVDLFELPSTQLREADHR